MNQELDRFTKYVNLYQKLVIAVAAKTVDHQTAEDVAQDVFLKMLEYLEYLKDDTVRAWLIVVTKNHVTDYLKKGGNNSIYPMEPESIAEHIVNTFESAEESFEKGEEQKAVLKLIETAHKLLYEKNPKWSYILIDSRIAGMSSAQIAKVMNTSTGNVDAIKSRARAYLRKKLGKQYYELVCNKLF